MTELETLERAKMYMEKLANGINPIDGSQIPDEKVINNVRLSRCFFYIADVLRQVIDNGGVPSRRRIKRFPFSSQSRGETRLPSPISQFQFRRPPKESTTSSMLRIWQSYSIEPFGIG